MEGEHRNVRREDAAPAEDHVQRDCQAAEEARRQHGGGSGDCFQVGKKVKDYCFGL